jgi:putative nucleotidyltransferase with HDIG domain
LPALSRLARLRILWVLPTSASMVERHRFLPIVAATAAPMNHLALLDWLALGVACALAYVTGLVACDSLCLVGDPDAVSPFLVAGVVPQIAFPARRWRRRRDLRRSFSSALAVLAGTVEVRDGYTELHCRRLAGFSRLLAERVGLREEEVEAVELGALLHDVGKIGIRDELLRKAGRFNAYERREMERHTALGAGIASSIHGISETTARCVRHHHERWDGSGYPGRLAGEEIPLAARIVAVVDVWDALSSARPYKNALPQERVLEMLRKHRGAQLDPELVDLFLEILEEQGHEMLDLIEQHGAGHRE